MVVSYSFFSLSFLLLLIFGGLLGWTHLKTRNWKKLRESYKKKKMDQEALAQAIKSKREMEILISLPGWKTLMEIAKIQTEGRTNSILLKPTESAYEQEYLKGEVQGMKALCAIPETVVEQAKAIIESQMPQEDGIE